MILKLKNIHWIPKILTAYARRTRCCMQPLDYWLLCGFSRDEEPVLGASNERRLLKFFLMNILIAFFLFSYRQNFPILSLPFLQPRPPTLPSISTNPVGIKKYIPLKHDLPDVSHAVCGHADDSGQEETFSNLGSACLSKHIYTNILGLKFGVTVYRVTSF